MKIQIFLLLFFLLCSCSENNLSSNSLISINSENTISTNSNTSIKKELNEYSFEVYYDYDYFLDVYKNESIKYVTPFYKMQINYTNWSSVSFALAGDLYKVKTYGYMESDILDPATISFPGGIESSEYIRANIKKIYNDKIIKDENNYVKSIEGFNQFQYIIINDKYQFIPLNEYMGDEIYYSYVDNEYKALYSFNPLLI